MKHTEYAMIKEFTGSVAVVLMIYNEHPDAPRFQALAYKGSDVIFAGSKVANAVDAYKEFKFAVSNL